MDELKVTVNKADIINKIGQKTGTSFDLDEVVNIKDFDYAEYKIRNFKIKGCDIHVGFDEDKPRTLMLYKDDICAGTCIPICVYGNELDEKIRDIKYRLTTKIKQKG